MSLTRERIMRQATPRGLCIKLKVIMLATHLPGGRAGRKHYFFNGDNWRERNLAGMTWRSLQELQHGPSSNDFTGSGLLPHSVKSSLQMQQVFFSLRVSISFVLLFSMVLEWVD